MTPEEAKEYMQSLVDEYLDENEDFDEEETHRQADYCLCELLKSLGQGEIVELYDSLPKWYA